MCIDVREAAVHESHLVSDILTEAALWLRNRGMPLWAPEELTATHLSREVRLGLFFLAWSGPAAVGVMRLTASDPLCWPDAARGEALYLHSLAVRRIAAGGRASAAMLRTATQRAARRGARYLRLDCEPARASLRRAYERLGFSLHSERVVGPFRVARYQLACARP